MDHFRPHLHPRPRFEGYYTNFTLPSTARIIIIVSSVPHAPVRPHMVSFSYIPASFPRTAAFHRECFVECIDMVDETGGFELRVPGLGVVRVYEGGGAEYEFGGGGWEFRARVQGEGRVEWVSGRERATPEGVLVRLPLPLHWHVHSLASPCRVRVRIGRDEYKYLDPEDGGGDNDDEVADTVGEDLGWVDGCFVHQEKNWAYSFPASHVWIQARRRGGRDRSGICLAGGAILGTQSYLITYHAQDAADDVSYAPPFASALSIPLPRMVTSKQNSDSDTDSSVSALTISPTLSTRISWDERTVAITVATPRTRLCIVASAPKDSFVGISAPFHDGHRENHVAQSFRAKVVVNLYRADRGGLGHWRLVEENCFEDGEAGLEFGGDIYEDRGNRDTAQE